MRAGAERWLEKWARSDRVPVFRHGVFLLACLTALILRRELRVGNVLLFILGTAAGLNFVLFLLSRQPKLGPWWLRASTLVGVGAWLSLVHVTGRSRSPFLVGLGLEVIGSALTFRPGGILLLAASTAVALVGVGLVEGAEASPWLLRVQAGLLAAMGGMAACVAWRWRTERARMAVRHVALRARLERLEREIDEARTLGQVGENVARLAHGLKNAVHSLRGFMALLEPRTARAEEEEQALEGLRAAINRLEDLAFSTLGSGAATKKASTIPAAEVRRILEDECQDLEAAFPEVHCRRILDRDEVTVAICPEVLREVVQALLRNAAEALCGRGEVALSTHLDGEAYHVEVRDGGAGPTAHALAGIFDPGVTTKTDGSGYGLFLARRLLATYGGELAARAGSEGGAVFSVSLAARGEAP